VTARGRGVAWALLCRFSVTEGAGAYEQPSSVEPLSKSAASDAALMEPSQNDCPDNPISAVQSTRARTSSGRAGLRSGASPGLGGAGGGLHARRAWLRQ